jgi:hypothetical protein
MGAGEPNRSDGRAVVLGERSQAGLPESWRAPPLLVRIGFLEAPGTRLPRTPETRHEQVSVRHAGQWSRVS